MILELTIRFDILTWIVRTGSGCRRRPNTPDRGAHNMCSPSIIRKRLTPWLSAASQLQSLLWVYKSSLLFMEKGKHFWKANMKLWQPYWIHYGGVCEKLYRKSSRGKKKIRVPGQWDKVGKTSGRGGKEERRQDSDFVMVRALYCVWMTVCPAHCLLLFMDQMGVGQQKVELRGWGGEWQAVSSEM